MLVCENVSYVYKTKYQKIEAVKNVSIKFEPGKMYAITGESGSGKSTLLSLLSGLDHPSDGNIYFNGKNMRNIDRDLYRLKEISIIYQMFYLFPLLTSVENVMLPLQLQGVRDSCAKKIAKECIYKVGLSEKNFSQYPKMMSGGEQQRIAIARALATGGHIILADEPTGNLDSKNEKKIVDILRRLASEQGYLVIVVTHNHEVSRKADCIFTMKDGEIIKVTNQS